MQTSVHFEKCQGLFFWGFQRSVSEHEHLFIDTFAGLSFDENRTITPLAFQCHQVSVVLLHNSSMCFYHRNAHGVRVQNQGGMFCDVCIYHKRLNKGVFVKHTWNVLRAIICDYYIVRSELFLCCCTLRWNV